MKTTKSQLKQLIKEELAGECGNLVDGIFGLVQNIDPNEVSDIFTSVFEKLPGVELEMADKPDGDEPPLPTDYQPGGTWEDRPTVGFAEELKRMIKEELSGLQQAAAEMSGAGAYEMPPEAMQRLMRTIGEVAPMLTPEEVVELAKALIDAGMLCTALDAPQEMGLEERK